MELVPSEVHEEENDFKKKQNTKVGPGAQANETNVSSGCPCKL